MARILIAEDSPDNAEILSEIMSDEGHQCLIAGNVADAIAIATAELPALAFLDMQMPETVVTKSVVDDAGLQVARALKANPDTASISLVVVSGADPEALRADALAAGAVAVARKPYEFERLIELVEEYAGAQ